MRVAAFLVLLFVAGSATAHFHILVPAGPPAKKDEAARLQLRFGHPFEAQMFDCGPADKVLVRAPDGKVTDVTAKLEKVTVAGHEGKKVAAYELPFTPTQRGDYVFLARMKPVWMEEEGELVEDTVRVVLHVQAQKGWDEPVGNGDLEWLPLTRPYGLLPGMVFQAVIRTELKLTITPIEGAPAPKEPQIGRPPILGPLDNALVEVERLNAEAPKQLPAEELITRTLKTAPNGVATTTLTEAGWWCLTTSRKAGEREHDGKKVPLRQRSTLWVQVSAP